MKNFFYSNAMLVILAILLMIAFFLPDFIGTIPALICGGMIIGLSLFVYNKWSQLPGEDEQKEETKDEPADPPA